MAKSADRLKYLGAVRAALARASQRAGTDNPRMTHASTWFTDNVVVGTPVVGLQDVEQALGFTQVDVAYLMLYLLDAGFIARGAITFGEHYMDEKFVFGPALIEAVDLKKTTKWPRVALSPDAANLNREVVRRFYADPESSPQAKELVLDEHGDVFVDHLGVWFSEEHEWAIIEHYLPRYKTIIEEALNTTGSGDVFDKWKWLADFHNYSMKANLKDQKRFLIDAGSAAYTFSSFSATI